jgi:hypothetical protein
VRQPKENKLTLAGSLKKKDLFRETQMVAAETTGKTLPNNTAVDTQRSRGFKHS